MPSLTCCSPVEACSKHQCLLHTSTDRVLIPRSRLSRARLPETTSLCQAKDLGKPNSVCQVLTLCMTLYQVQQKHYLIESTQEPRKMGCFSLSACGNWVQKDQITCPSSPTAGETTELEPEPKSVGFWTQGAFQYVNINAFNFSQNQRLNPARWMKWSRKSWPSCLSVLNINCPSIGPKSLPEQQKGPRAFIVYKLPMSQRWKSSLNKQKSQRKPY